MKMEICYPKKFNPSWLPTSNVFLQKDSKEQNASPYFSFAYLCNLICSFIILKIPHIIEQKSCRNVADNWKTQKNKIKT